MDLLILISCLIFSLIPTKKVLLWLYNHAKLTRSKLNTPLPDLFFSKLGPIHAIGNSLQWVKGAAIPFLIQNYTENTTFAIIFISIAFALHVWAPLYPRSEMTQSIGYFMWGFFSYADTSLIILFPLLTVLFIIISNNWEWGLFLGFVSNFLILWERQSSSEILMISLICIGISFFTKANALFRHLESSELSLDYLFKNR